MTRKDYIKFAGLIDAEVLKVHKDLWAAQQSKGLAGSTEEHAIFMGKLHTIKDIARGIADILQDDNPRFDMDKFMIASFGEEWDRW